MTRSNTLAIVVMALLMGVTSTLYAQGARGPDDVESGAETYLQHCASCHGRGGRGDGALASSLKTRPTDLTQLARRNGGRFPDDRLRALLAGRRPMRSVHGDSDMPVWGPLLRQLNPYDGRVDIRLNRLLAHLEQLQQPLR
jgi:mono/diheme cytochrome c family protein